MDSKVMMKQRMLNAADEKRHQDIPAKDSLTESEEEKHVDFNEACQKFGGKKASPKKIAPVKPKRVKIAQPVQVVIDPPCHAGRHADDSEVKQEKAVKQENRVELREKKGRAETEDERRQRLSVHMDEIMRGNIVAAMEIFDNLRKQEELQSLLSRVEEIEQDTSEVDVKSLRSVFENVPEWVVSADKTEQIKVKEENKDKRLPSIKENTQTKTSMAHVFGDLERASEEIMNLKEQTLARLVDIEETIKKALYSVSTLKSDSDIAGLSCLFKESLGTVQGAPSSGNISKISIESSRTKSHESAAQANAARAAGRGGGGEASSPKQRSSPPSSPAFISIQSAARKTDRGEAGAPETRTCKACQQSPKVEEKFRTTKTLTCNSPAGSRRGDPRRGGQKQATCSQPNPNREVSVLQLHTDREGKSILGTTTVTENYERTDNFGNRFYSSKTSTVVTTQPETATSSTNSVALSPAVYQVTTYPEVQLPVNQMPQ
ncbi:xin actin-binding repeat-containing protein 1 [Salarias fasciatus]|uniref:xin actin-binding repeat-containing protein 1 n=1 Tax=Salarias fasciatus TaxID=181472 RepID=UPI001176CBB8|nr:xin actin-binding repeat-containing protein 1-like [Salarias fasciatus]